MSDDPEHLQAHLHMTATNDRGFRSFPPVPGTHGGRPAGQAVIWESSAANGPHLWLDVQQPEDRNHPENGRVIEARIHMTVEDAVRLAEQIQHLAVHHYQNQYR